jgi:hypothetical protein
MAEQEDELSLLIQLTTGVLSYHVATWACFIVANLICSSMNLWLRERRVVPLG